MSAPPLVVIGDDWGRHPSTLQHLFRRLIGRQPLVWVNGFGHRLPRLTIYDLRRAAEKAVAMLRPPDPPASGPAPDVIVHPRALPWHNVAAVHAMNTASLLRDIRRALEQVAPGQRPLLVTGTPIAEGLIGHLGEVASIYYCIDDHAELPYVSAQLIRPKEEALLRRVDAVIATAEALVQKKRPASGLAFQLPQGVNYDHFAAPCECPVELRDLPRPIIGFAGGVSECCDLTLIAALADRNPHASVVLVGPVSVDTAAIQRPNVHLLERRAYADLPGYVQHFDVGIIPYVLNEWTRSVDPLKLLEYLAAGLPVVTTAIPEVAKYADAVEIASTMPEFLDAVDAVLAAPGATRETGQALARQHSWDARAEAFLGIARSIVRTRAERPRPT